MKDKPKKPNQAAALKYDGVNAPKIVAKGVGATADAIIEAARQHNIHLHNDPILLGVLSRLELGEEIPHPLYLAVAKVIAFAYYLQGKHPDRQTKQTDSVDLSQSLSTRPTDLSDD